jgi:ribosomal protein S24E
MSVVEADVRENKLLRRMEIRAKLGYEGKPLTRKEVITALASYLKIPEDRVVMVKAECLTGMRMMRVHAHAYQNIEDAKRFERPYILKRSGLIAS